MKGFSHSTSKLKLPHLKRTRNPYVRRIYTYVSAHMCARCLLSAAPPRPPLHVLPIVDLRCRCLLLPFVASVSRQRLEPAPSSDSCVGRVHAARGRRRVSSVPRRGRQQHGRGVPAVRAPVDRAALGKGRGAGGPGPAAPPADEGRGTRQPVVAQQVVVSSSVRSEPNISPIDYRRKARINCYSNSSSSKILAMFPGLL